jgi:glutamate:GABA antiporter
MMKKIPLFSLIILIVAAIDNIRNLPSAALFGSAMIFFFAFSAIAFLIPTALVAAELSATFPEQGGVYHWVRKAFGEKLAMAAIWLQWINTMVWYPTMLSFIAGTAAYLINPELAQNKLYLVSFILVVFWGLTWINTKGIHISALVNNVCATMGTIVPMLFLITLGAIWVFNDHPLQIDLDHTLPSLKDSTNWVSLIAIMASFVGIELAGVHVGDIREPQKNFPKAILVATLFIFLSMVLGSFAIAFVLPAKEINLISGVMQVFTNFFHVFHLGWLAPVLPIFMVVGSIGGMINWLISPAKGLLHAAEFGFLPSLFTKKNRAGVATNVLVGQAIVVSLLCLIFLLVPSVNAFYWFLTALSTELYMIMYVLMFCAAVKLHYTHASRPKIFKIPGGTIGMWITTLLGFVGCATTIVVSFFPPDNVAIGSHVRYLWMIAVGNLVTISPLLLFYYYKKKGASP